MIDRPFDCCALRYFRQSVGQSVWKREIQVGMERNPYVQPPAAGWKPAPLLPYLPAGTPIE